MYKSVGTLKNRLSLCCACIFGISVFLISAESIAADTKLNVCAVPQLYDSLEVIKNSYVKDKKIKLKDINLVFRPASVMYNQIQNNELACDVFLGNDIRYPGLLIKSEVAIRDSLLAFTRAKLVLWSITSIVDKSCNVLTKGVYNKISLPNPKTQASGFAAISALNKMGIKTDKIRSKLMYGANEYQTLSFIINGNVIMGILPQNLLFGSSFATTGSFCEIPDGYYEPLYYYSVVLKVSNKENAAAFVTYLHDEKSKKIFLEHGFR